MKKFYSDQEKFWAGDFGDSYVERNKSDKLLASNLNFFCKALNSATSIENCIEFGANVGMNIEAIKKLFPDLDFSAVEINKKASKILSNVIPKENIFETSIIDFFSNKKWDLVLIKGVLIHINPDLLEKFMKYLKKLQKSIYLLLNITVEILKI